MNYLHFSLEGIRRFIKIYNGRLIRKTEFLFSTYIFENTFHNPEGAFARTGGFGFMNFGGLQFKRLDIIIGRNL